MQDRPPPASDDATAISDYLLEKTGDAYFVRDFDAFAKWFHLPQVVGTFAGDRTVHTRAELKTMFDAVCEIFEAQDVVALHRTTLAAKFLDPDTVQSTFLSRQVLANNLFGEELVAHGLLKRIDGQWKVAEGRYATQDRAITQALMSR